VIRCADAEFCEVDAVSKFRRSTKSTVSTVSTVFTRALTTVLLASSSHLFWVLALKDLPEDIFDGFLFYTEILDVAGG
jgi:IS4 transposase